MVSIGSVAFTNGHISSLRLTGENPFFRTFLADDDGRGYKRVLFVTPSGDMHGEPDPLVQELIPF